MLHNEHFRKADESYEIRHDNIGNAIHVFITDGEAIVFPTLFDFFSYCYLGRPNIERFYLEERLLDNLYSFEEYQYYKLKEIAEKINSGEIPSPPDEAYTII